MSTVVVVCYSPSKGKLSQHQLPPTHVKTTETHVEDPSTETSTSESAVPERPPTTIVVVVHVAGTSRWSTDSTSGRMDVLARLERLLS